MLVRLAKDTHTCIYENISCIRAWFFEGMHYPVFNF